MQHERYAVWNVGGCKIDVKSYDRYNVKVTNGQKQGKRETLSANKSKIAAEWNQTKRLDGSGRLIGPRGGSLEEKQTCEKVHNRRLIEINRVYTLLKDTHNFFLFIC